MEDNDLNQLADMLVDWSGVDIDHILANCEPDADTTVAAAEFLKCLIWTLGQDPEAGRLLQALVQTERTSRRYRG
jgi:hypothetical protein